MKSNNIALSVANVSKKYRLGKSLDAAADYLTLRDVLSNSTKNLLIQSKNLITFNTNTKTNYVEEFWALNDISFDIEKGTTLGIIGRNGAGKSTLLKILSRITHPTSGVIKIYGQVSSLLEVGTGFHPELTGRENIFLNGAILGMTQYQIKKKFSEIVEFAGVEKFLDTPVKRYSSGMYIRLAFAVAANLQPDILIVDEVLAVGDAEFQKKCLGKMEEFGKDGRTVIFVSHNEDAIEKFCEKTIVLEKGKIAILDKTKIALDYYAKLAGRSSL